MMELGSEFSLGPSESFCEDNIFRFLSEFDTLYVDSGRSALKLLRRVLPPGDILIPSYICESVYTSFPADHIRFYQLTTDLQIDGNDLLRKLNHDVSAVYLHYFNGVLPSKALLQKLRDAREKWGFQIVEDTTHSIFSAPLTVGDYGVCSLRKWFPVPDGGVLYGRDLNGLAADGEASWVREKAYAMRQKRRYLFGSGDPADKREYRRLFAACDHALDMQGDCYAISGLSRGILSGCSITRMLFTRQKNAAQVKNMVARQFPWLQPLAWPRRGECSLVLPVKTEHRDALRAYLVERGVYCAVHWPLRGTPMETLETASVSDQELSFPIDQRYHAAEMEYLFNCLRDYGKETHAETD